MIAVHQGRRIRRLTTRQVNWLRQVIVSDVAIMYVYILYLRGEHTIIVILYTGLPPITTTIASQWLNSLIFHDDIQRIAAEK